MISRELPPIGVWSEILLKIAKGKVSAAVPGDTSTLANPAVVEVMVANRIASQKIRTSGPDARHLR